MGRRVEGRHGGPGVWGLVTTLFSVQWCPVCHPLLVILSYAYRYRLTLQYLLLYGVVRLPPSSFKLHRTTRPFLLPLADTLSFLHSRY